MPTNQFAINKSIVGTSRMLSTVLSPLLMPTYGVALVMIASVLCVLGLGTRVAVLVVCMGITCILPLLFLGVMIHLDKVTNLHVNRREERFIPYLFTMACYLAAALYLNHCHSPRWFIMFMVGCALAVLVALLINFKWKISAHMIGIGGVVALIYQLQVLGLGAFSLYWLLCISILLSGLLGSARLALRRHTTLQVLAGFAVGFACVTLTMKYFG